LQSFEPLFRIENKKDFKLRIQLEQKRIVLKTLAPFFDVLRPILSVFEEAGPDVAISWVHKYNSGESHILRPLNDLIRHPRAGWRDDFVKSSKNEPIDSIYRGYQHEDEPGYEYDCSRDEPHDEDAWDEYLIGEEPEGAWHRTSDIVMARRKIHGNDGDRFVRAFYE
jgi:hypothetical protein